MPAEGRSAMIATETHLTLWIATAVGAYMLAAGLGGAIERSRWSEIIRELRHSPGLTFLAGVVTFSLGAVIVMVHNDWSSVLSGFVSLMGWAAVIEGLILLAFPKLLLDLSERLMTPYLVNAFIAFAIVLGGLLVLLGLTGTVEGAGQ